ncbi:hypothetical protein [Peribacillus sp. SCS-155]|uniref:hypothetical protein n=1 Tax=Peribacillus sedimenti TaxID=3115297 RepID=UPI003905C5B4
MKPCMPLKIGKLSKAINKNVYRGERKTEGAHPALSCTGRDGGTVPQPLKLDAYDFRVAVRLQ